MLAHPDKKRPKYRCGFQPLPEAIEKYSERIALEKTDLKLPELNYKKTIFQVKKKVDFEIKYNVV
jgi:hypothetical protein